MNKRTRWFIGTALLIAAPFVFVVAGQLYSIGLTAVSGVLPGSGIGRDVLLSLAHVTAWGYALLAAGACALSGLYVADTDFEKKIEKKQEGAARAAPSPQPPEET